MTDSLISGNSLYIVSLREKLPTFIAQYWLVPGLDLCLILQSN